MLAVLVGDNSKSAVAELIFGPGRTSGAWVSESVAALPLPALSKLNSRMLQYFVRRFSLKRGALLFGKLLPVGIGAIVGAIGNWLVGKKIVRNAADGIRPTAGALAGHLACAADHALGGLVLPNVRSRRISGGNDEELAALISSGIGLSGS